MSHLDSKLVSIPPRPLFLTNLLHSLYVHRIFKMYIHCPFLSSDYLGIQGKNRYHFLHSICKHNPGLEKIRDTFKVTQWIHRKLGLWSSSPDLQSNATTGILNLGCSLQSFGKLLNTSAPRLHPRIGTSGGKTRRLWWFLKLPRWFQCAVQTENPRHPLQDRTLGEPSQENPDRIYWHIKYIHHEVYSP